jgi:predicted Fe-Mo cluster-binding NifX family protein
VAGRKASSEKDQITHAGICIAYGLSKAPDVKAAFATWQGRIAPLFDTSRQAWIVECLRGRIVSEQSQSLKDPSPVGKAMCLVEWEVSALICGAISRQLQAMVSAHGIRVIPFVSGDLRQVIQAWLEGRIQDGQYKMPGCGHRSAVVRSTDS